ncbi:MAG: hypothetical protein Q7U82_09970 [Gammaproteobacteria bacterium]|nr:hypothetical protein [Gammaproteobacteria bacterium]
MKSVVSILIAISLGVAAASHSADNPPQSSLVDKLDLIEPENKVSLPLRDFNRGRPANFYSLSFFDAGRQELCTEILAALNVEMPRGSDTSANVMANLLLKNSFSVPWRSIPYVGPNGTVARNPIDVVTVDIGGDMIMEQLFRTTGMVSSRYVHGLHLLRENRFESDVSALTADMSKEVFWRGFEFEDRGLGSAMADKVQDSIFKYHYLSESPLSFTATYTEVINISRQVHFLIMTADIIERDLDVFAFSLSNEDELSVSCAFSSNFRIINSN